MANEKRLIDANALQLEPDPWGGMNGVLILGRSTGKTLGLVQVALKKMVENAPTVDAVEVVRCKDCKAWNRYEPASVSGRCGLLFMMRMDDDFCSYGERRNNEG